MNMRSIRSDDDHAAALRRIEELWDAPPASEQGAELDALVTLVVAYEESRWPI
jgi:HTH-type transcriptional regulator/antitoxin HigA